MMVCLGAFASAVYTGMDSTLNKFGGAEEGFEGRLCISSNMIPMLMDYPVAGVGSGQFSIHSTQGTVAGMSRIENESVFP